MISVTKHHHKAGVGTSARPCPTVAREFQQHWDKFLPAHDPRVQRVAAVLWKLVNRLDPALVHGPGAASKAGKGA